MLLKNLFTLLFLLILTACTLNKPPTPPWTPAPMPTQTNPTVMPTVKITPTEIASQPTATPTASPTAIPTDEPLPIPTIAPTATPTSPPADDRPPFQIVIQWGDTLRGLAEKHSPTHDESRWVEIMIAHDNAAASIENSHLRPDIWKNPDRIYAGEVIWMPQEWRP